MMSDEDLPAAKRKPKIEITFDDLETPGAPEPDTAPDASQAVDPVCASCGESLQPELAFCTGCGAPVGGDDRSGHAWIDPEPETEVTRVEAQAPPPPPPPPTSTGGAVPPDGSIGGRLAARAARSWRPVLLGVAAIGAAVAVFFVVQSIFGTKSGAESPEAAVQGLIDALSAEDPAGVAAMLAPDETRGLGELTSETVDRARGAGVVSGEQGGVDGVSVTSADLQYDTEELNNALARVSIAGGQIDIATKARDASTLAQRAGMSDATATLDTNDFQLMTVKQDGRWFVSPGYTLAETITTNNDAQAGDFTVPDDEEPTGAETAEDAVKDFGTAVLSGDVGATQSLLAPPERALARSYSAALNEALDGGDPVSSLGTGEIASGDFSTEDLGGGYAKVEINRLSGELGGDPVSFDGQCVRYRGESYCSEDLANAIGLSEQGFAEGLPRVRLFSGRPFLVVHEEDSKWSVSLPATAIEYAREFLRQHPKDTQIAQLFGEPSLVAPSAKVVAGEQAQGETDEPWGTIEVDAGKAWGTAVYAEREDQVLDVEPTGSDSLIWLGPPSGESITWTINVPEGRSSARGMVVAARARGGAVSARTFAVPKIDQKAPTRSELEITVPLTARTPVVALTGKDDVAFKVEETRSAYLSCTGTCTFPLVIAAKTPRDARSVKVTLSDLGATLDGETFQETWVSADSPTSYLLNVPSGETASITATPAGDYLDVYLETDGTREDQYLSGVSETMTVTGPYSGTITVGAYGSESDDVSLSISSN